MAKELTPEQIAALQEQLAAEQAKNAKLVEAMDASKIPVAKPIPGKFTAKWNSPAGDEVSKTVKFKDGHKAVHLKDGRRVDAAGLIALANSGKASDEAKKNSPALADLTQADAKAYLTHLVQIQYGYLEETK